MHKRGKPQEVEFGRVHILCQMQNVDCEMIPKCFLSSFCLPLTVKVDDSPEKCSTSLRMPVEETAPLTQVRSKLILPHLFLRFPSTGKIQKCSAEYEDCVQPKAALIDLSLKKDSQLHTNSTFFFFPLSLLRQDRFMSVVQPLESK